MRTDLALEAAEAFGGPEKAISGVSWDHSSAKGFPLTTVRVASPEGADAIGKPVGIYHTLDLAPLVRREENAFARAVSALAGILAGLDILKGTACVLVVGLGNRSITPDAIGPKAAGRLLVTRHLIHEMPEPFEQFRPVAALAAGVLGTTGIESGEIVRAVVEQIHPAAVLAIDALAARKVERLCATIQVADSGIAPGSGVGNHRFALNKESLGVPVAAIGVPTVVDGATLAVDLLAETGMAQLKREQLVHAYGGDLIVTPRDIDQRVEDMAKVIGYGISLALQPSLKLSDLEMLLE